MTRFWTCHWQFRYWRPDVNREGGPVHSSGSNLFSKRGVQPGDIVYIISLSGGQLYLGGRMTVKQILSRSEVARLWNRDMDSMYDAAEWIVDPEDKGTLLHLHRRLCPALTKQIRFQTKTEIKEPFFVTETELDNQATRGVRELTAESAAFLDRIIEITDRWPKSDQLITVTEEQLLNGPAQDGIGQFSLPEEVPNDSVSSSGSVLHKFTEFFDIGGVSVHDDFQTWRTNNQDGKFLTFATRTRANLHGARCQHLGSGPPYFLLKDGYGSLTKKRKVCGSEEELLAWATENGVNVKRCDHCLRDNLIGNGQVQQGNEEIRLPEEIPDGSAYSEGSVQRILINRYERDPRAREECIRHYGTT